MSRCVGEGALLAAVIAAGFSGTLPAERADWPMWRHDSARSAKTAEELPNELHLRWVRDFPKLKPAYREQRLQFDAGYEPVVLDKSMFIASSRDDSVTALDTETGKPRWQFFAEGPIRFAPVAWRDRVFFGSDDGCLYCLDSVSGKVTWKFRAVPSQRKVLSGGRMISLWPVRGGPVLHDERIYFAAGVWPFEGVFIYCIDAATGKVVWRNDEASFVYGQHPHDAKAMGGVTPQGYLVVAGDDLVVPCGQAMPARFNLQTGKLKSFELPKPGRQPGGWFAIGGRSSRRSDVGCRGQSRSARRQESTKVRGRQVSANQNQCRRKDLQVRGRLSRMSKGQSIRCSRPDGKLFVVTLEGHIYCFGEKPADSCNPVAREVPPRTVVASDDFGCSHRRSNRFSRLLRFRNGYALLSGRRQRSTTIRPKQT